MDYFDFDLRIGPGEQGSYRLALIDSPGGATSARLELALDDPQLRRCLETIERGISVQTRNLDLVRQEDPAQPLSSAVQVLGQALFDSLTRERSFYACYHTSLVQAQNQGKGLRLRLRLEVPELACLPWEYLYDPHLKHNFLNLSRGTPVVRHIDMELPIAPLILEPPIRILGMVGARQGLNVSDEQALMAQATEHLVEQGMIKIEWVNGSTWRALAAGLRSGTWHIFHFIGHGGFDEQTGEGLIFLEGEEQIEAPHSFPARDLGSLLAGHPSLKLAVLNSCEGARASTTSLFSSTGTILARCGIPAVVSMQYQITDRAAVEFSRSFYDSLANGEAVDSALTDARMAIKMALEDPVEWGKPVLHMRARDGVLFRIDLVHALFGASNPRSSKAEPALSPKPAEALEGADQKGLLILLRRVRQYWITGVLGKSVQRSALLELPLEEIEGGVESPWGSVLEIPGTGSKPLPPGQSLGARFEEMGGSLLILGEPGSGKTITLLELARDLLDRAEREASRPVPVIFNLSSWNDPSRNLADWLIDELAAKYLIPKRVGAAWVGENRLLLLLDGLDDVRAEARAACVQAVNNFTRRFLFSPLVVCSRLKEYLELPVRLNLNGAVRLHPLASEQVLAFTARAGRRLEALHHLLQRDSAMLVVARSPLMLSLMVEAYQDLSMAALANADAKSHAARQYKVMELYVARMYGRAPVCGERMLAHERVTSSLIEEQAIRWLSWLAHGMQEQDQTVFLIENLQPGWLSSRWQVAIYVLLSRMLVAGLLGVILGVVFILTELISVDQGALLFFDEPLLVLSGLAGTALKTLLISALGTGVLLGSGVAILDSWHLRGGSFWTPLCKLGEPWRTVGYVLIYFLSLMFPFQVILPLVAFTEWVIMLLDGGATTNAPSVLTIGIEGSWMFWASAPSLIGASIWGTRAARQREGYDILTVETLGWSWTDSRKGLWKGFLFGFVGLVLVVFGFLYVSFLYAVLVGFVGAAVGVFVSWLIGRDVRRAAGYSGAIGAGCCLVLLLLQVRLFGEGLVVAAVVFGLCCAIVGATFGGLQGEVRPIKALPNQGIRLSLKNAFTGGILVSMPFGLVGLAAGPFLSLFEAREIFSAAGGLALIAGLFGGLWFGGVDWIYHFVLRLVFFLWGTLPLRLIQFLDYAADELRILQKVGGGYMFIHRSLLEYFAALEKEPTRKTS